VSSSGITYGASCRITVVVLNQDTNKVLSCAVALLANYRAVSGKMLLQSVGSESYANCGRMNSPIGEISKLHVSLSPERTTAGANSPGIGAAMVFATWNRDTDQLNVCLVLRVGAYVHYPVQPACLGVTRIEDF
jgi:hypothetical protein